MWNDSCHSCEWVMPHVNDSCHTLMDHVTWELNDALITCDMTHSHATWVITCDMTHSHVTWSINVWHESFTCGMTHSHVTWVILMWHDVFICNMKGALNWSEDCFYYFSERNNVVVFFRTLKVQSFVLTEVSDCDLLIVVTSSTFLKRKHMLKEKSNQSKISSRLLAYIYTCVLCTHIRIYVCRDLVHSDSPGLPGVSSRLLGSHPSTPSV